MPADLPHPSWNAEQLAAFYALQKELEADAPLWECQKEIRELDEEIGACAAKGDWEGFRQNIKRMRAVLRKSLGLPPEPEPVDPSCN
jgi:hypothetical protein